MASSPLDTPATCSHMAKRHAISIVQDIADPENKEKRCDLLLTLGEMLFPAGRARASTTGAAQCVSSRRICASSRRHLVRRCGPGSDNYRSTTLQFMSAIAARLWESRKPYPALTTSKTRWGHRPPQCGATVQDGH
jgi:hypothetical protein